MKDEKRSELNRALALKGADESVIEREGWPAVDRLSDSQADDVIEWLKLASPHELRGKPEPKERPPSELAEPEKPQEPDVDQKRTVFTDAPDKDEVLVTERPFGVWRLSVFYKAGNARVYAKRYNGGPDNEWTRNVEVGNMAEAESRAKEFTDDMLASLGMR